MAEYQGAFAAYADAIKSGKSAQEATNAYLNSINGTDASKDQPLLCLAAWNQNVGYTSLPSKEVPYTQGSDVEGSTSMPSPVREVVPTHMLIGEPGPPMLGLLPLLTPSFL